MTSVSTVIPTWNGRQLLEQFLPSVVTAARAYRQTTGADVEIVIVDDGSTDDTVQWLTMQTASSDVAIRVVPRQSSGGFGAACNDGISTARHPLVLLLNNDVAPDPSAIAPLAARFARPNPSSPLFSVHGRVRDFDTNAEAGAGQLGRFRRGFIRMHESYLTQSPGDWPSMFASGGSSMIDRARFLELGGFDPLFAPFYFEDVELSYRAWKRGFTVGYEPASEMRHRFSSTIRRRSSAAEIRRISQRNRLLLNWIHLHDPAWFVQHVGWVVMIFLTSPLTMRLDFAGAVVDALGQLREVRTRRKDERRLARRRDRDVMRVFDQLRGKAGVEIRR
jgi:GT2 family glycosyltransferase